MIRLSGLDGVNGVSLLEINRYWFITKYFANINHSHPALRLHALRGKLEGLHSVSINLSYRITLVLLIQDQQVIPVNVGDHDAVH